MDLESKARKTEQVIIRVIRTLIDKDYKHYQMDSIVVKRGLERLKILYPYDFADDRITDYVVYQIYRYRDLIKGRQKGWSMSWCFSENAVQKFKAQFIAEDGKSGMNYYIDQWLHDGDLDRQMLTDMLADLSEHRLAKYIFLQSEELTKKRFLNTETGLMMCVCNTTGWSPLSPTCQVCKNVDECKVYTKKSYPELYRIRIEKTKN